jgi:hypothetical protein
LASANRERDLAADLAGRVGRRVDVDVGVATRNCLDDIGDGVDADRRLRAERRLVQAKRDGEVAGASGDRGEVQHHRSSHASRTDVDVPGARHRRNVEHAERDRNLVGADVDAQLRGSHGTRQEGRRFFSCREAGGHAKDLGRGGARECQGQSGAACERDDVLHEVLLGCC